MSSDQTVSGHLRKTISSPGSVGRIRDQALHYGLVNAQNTHNVVPLNKATDLIRMEFYSMSPSEDTNILI